MALFISHNVSQDLLEVPSPTERTVSLGSEVIASIVRDLPLQWRRVDVLHPPVVIESLPHVRHDIPGNLQALNIFLSDERADHGSRGQTPEILHLSFPPDAEHDGRPVDVREVEPETLGLVLSVIFPIFHLNSDPQLERFPPRLVDGPLLQSGRGLPAGHGGVCGVAVQAGQQDLHHRHPVSLLLQDRTSLPLLARRLELKAEFPRLQTVADFADSHDLYLVVLLRKQ